jgi:uncharacterized membrane protein
MSTLDLTKNGERKKSFILLIAGIVIFAAALAFAIYAHGHSLKESTEVGNELSNVKKQIEQVEAGTAGGDLEHLKALKDELSDKKLGLERPFSFAMVALFLALSLIVKGAYNAFVGTVVVERFDVKKMALAGLMAALCYIGFAVFKIDIPVGTEKTAFHLGNVFCVLAALLLGGYLGGLAGAVGMTIGDLTTAYVTSAPRTFLLKLMIGLIVGLVAHKIFKLDKPHNPKYVTGVTVLASACGMVFNIFADPTLGYFYKVYILGIPQQVASIFAKWTAMTTFVNAIIAIISASVFYLAIRPALIKAGLFIRVTQDTEVKA